MLEINSNVQNQKPLVSVITPCYNGARFIEQWLCSILIQTYSNLQIIFVNDGSTDNTKERFDAAKEKIINRGYEVLYLEKENGGAASAVNDALKVVAGDYIMLFDVDDILMPTNIAQKADYLTAHQEIDIVRNNGYFVREGNLEDSSCKLEIVSYENQVDLFDEFVSSQICVFPGTYMLRAKTFFDNVKDKEIYLSRFGQNLQMIAPVLRFGKAAYIDTPLIRYVVYKSSHSHTPLFSTKLEVSNGYQSNLIAVINSLDITQTEKNLHIEKVKASFAVTNFNLAIEYNQKVSVGLHYQNLKSLNVLNPKIKRLYTLSQLPFGCVVIKNIPRAKRVFKRLAYKILNKKD